MILSLFAFNPECCFCNSDTNCFVWLQKLLDYEVESDEEWEEEEPGESLSHSEGVSFIVEGIGMHIYLMSVYIPVL